MKILPFVLATSFLTVFASSGPPAFADDVVLRADLDPPSGAPEPLAEGRARRVDGDDGRIRFVGRLEIPYPNNGLGIDTFAKANAADFRMTLSRGGTPYAECQLVFEAACEFDGVRAEYKVVLQERGGIERFRRGTCDTDPLAAGVQAGLPEVAVDDTARVFRRAQPGVTVAEGTFELR